MKKLKIFKEYEIIARVIIFIGFFVLLVSYLFYNGFKLSNIKSLNEFGDWIGGVLNPWFSLAGFFLIAETLRMQRNEIKRTINSFDTERFETTFFGLITNKNNYINNMTISDLHAQQYFERLLKELIQNGFKKNFIQFMQNKAEKMLLVHVCEKNIFVLNFIHNAYKQKKIANCLEYEKIFEQELFFEERIITALVLIDMIVNDKRKFKSYLDINLISEVIGYLEQYNYFPETCEIYYELKKTTQKVN